MQQLPIEGRVLFTPVKTAEGDGKRGHWERYQVVIEHESGQYPKKFVASMWGDKYSQYKLDLVEGQHVQLLCDVDAREYNGKWYDEITCFAVVGTKQPQQQTYQAQQQEQQVVQPQQPPRNQNEAFVQMTAQTVQTARAQQEQPAKDDPASSDKLPF